jgi:hypothetical protein
MYTIQVDPEQIDKIVVKELRNSYTYLDPKNRPECGMYYRDEVEDLKEIAITREAFARVLDYYGEKV